jgi:hypothetical protein
VAPPCAAGKSSLESGMNRVAISIEQIECAINVWRDRHPAPEGNNECPTLCVEARALADIYALMIVHRQTTIDAAQLTRIQLDALQGALTASSI